MTFKPVIYKMMTADKKTYEVINVNFARSFLSPVLYNPAKDIWVVVIVYDDDTKTQAYFETQTKANMFFHKLCDTVNMPIKELQPWINDVKVSYSKEDK